MNELTAAIDRFAASLEGNAVQTAMLGTAITESEQRRRRVEIIAGLAALLLIIMVGGVIWALSIVISTQDTIKDCTDPTRRTAACARRGQENTVKVLAAIRRDQVGSIYVNGVCRIRSETEKEYTACMRTELHAVQSGKLKVPGVDN